MQLTDIHAVESLTSGTIYSAQSSTSVAPGQNIKFNNMVEILRCDPSTTGYKLLFYCTEDLPEVMQFELIGKPIRWLPNDPVVMFCEGMGNFTAIHWLNNIRADSGRRLSSILSSLVLSEQTDFKFQPVPSRYITPEYPTSMIAAMPLLDDLGIISRLVCEQFKPGCYEGTLAEMVANMPLKPERWAAFASQGTIKDITMQIGEPVFTFFTEDLKP